MSAREKWDLCRIAQIYRANHQFEEARRLDRACLAVGQSVIDRKFVLRDLVQEDLDCADFARARKDIAVLEKEAPETFRQMKPVYDQIPAD